MNNSDVLVKDSRNFSGLKDDPFIKEIQDAPASNPNNTIVFKYNTNYNFYESDCKYSTNNDFSFINEKKIEKVTKVMNMLKKQKHYNYKDIKNHMKYAWCQII